MDRRLQKEAESRQAFIVFVSLVGAILLGIMLYSGSHNSRPADIGFDDERPVEYVR